MKETYFRSHVWNLRAWRFNRWVFRNTGSLLYILLTIVILLQQFPATEPLAFGLWWVTLISTIGGAFVFHDSDWRSLVWKGLWAVAGVLLQAWIVVFHWDALVQFDNGLRMFREAFARLFTGGYYGHLLFGHVLWLICSARFWYLARKEKCLFYPIPRKPAYDISVRAPYWWERAA